MSRVGKKPIPVPEGVQVNIDQNHVMVKGAKGQLEWDFNPELKVMLDDGHIKVECPIEQKMYRALHGLTRTLISNMVTGVTQGFEKKLEIVGVGYRANVEGKTLILQLGFSHPVRFPIPDGIQIEVEKQTLVSIKGIDKQQVGQVAANIRAFRPPEPYKGKGIKYADEVIRRKAGKSGA
jgi:large subunit ribosomal protein L6